MEIKDNHELLKSFVYQRNLHFESGTKVRNFRVLDISLQGRGYVVMDVESGETYTVDETCFDGAKVVGYTNGNKFSPLTLR